MQFALLLHYMHRVVFVHTAHSECQQQHIMTETTIHRPYRCYIPDQYGSKWVQPCKEMMLQSLTAASHVFPNKLAKQSSRQYGLMLIQGFTEVLSNDSDSEDSEDEAFEKYQAQAYATYTSIVPLAALQYVPSLKGSGADQRVLTTVVWPVPPQWFSDNDWGDDLHGLDEWLNKVTERLVGLANAKEDYYNRIVADPNISDAVKTAVAMQLFAQPNELGGPVATAIN